MRDAMEKEVVSLIAGLVTHRTQLQESLDSGLQDSIFRVTELCWVLLGHMDLFLEFDLESDSKIKTLSFQKTGQC